MSITRLTVIFNGAKFDYEVNGAKHEWLKKLEGTHLFGGNLYFEDINGKYVEINPRKCPVLEIESIGG